MIFYLKIFPSLWFYCNHNYYTCNKLSRHKEDDAYRINDYFFGEWLATEC